jgi:hypothetical protein
VVNDGVIAVTSARLVTDGLTAIGAVATNGTWVELDAGFASSEGGLQHGAGSQRG